MPFSLLKKTARDPKKPSTTAPGPAAEPEPGPAEEPAALRRNGSVNPPPRSWRGDGDEDEKAGACKERRSSRRDILHDIRSRLTGRPAAATPQRGRAVSQPPPRLPAPPQDARTVRSTRPDLSPRPFQSFPGRFSLVQSILLLFCNAAALWLERTPSFTFTFTSPAPPPIPGHTGWTFHYVGLRGCNAASPATACAFLSPPPPPSPFHRPADPHCRFTQPSLDVQAKSDCTCSFCYCCRPSLVNTGRCEEGGEWLASKARRRGASKIRPAQGFSPVAPLPSIAAGRLPMIFGLPVA